MSGRQLPVRPNSGPAWIVSVDPPVFLAGIPSEDYLGIARPFAERFGNIDAGFIVFPTWSLERPGYPEGVRADFLEHAAEYPRHAFRFICNTQRETNLLLGQGLPAEFLNKNFTVSDTSFRPLSNVEVEFDAIYNARFVPDKRHGLAALVPRTAYLTYLEKRNDPTRVAQFHDTRRAVVQRGPGHVLINELQDGLPVWMSHEQTNAALARAAVGLVLSPAEGSSYASMEYMLAGLPVVSTPSVGGRDVYFDPDFCIVCEPTPAAVRDAVAELRTRDIPREDVRARTLARIAPARQRFLALIDEILGELGAESSLAGRGWAFGGWSGVGWRPYSAHLDQFAVQANLTAHSVSDAPSGLPAGVQMEAQEIEPVVAAISVRPGCRLLVFGCGNDSAAWETANAGGETAFVEDDPRWASATRAKLQAAQVHQVSYRTRVADWRSLLDSPIRLQLALPPEIVERTWDVILVDGPAGHNPDSPGRMKSIFAASQLVAPGGVVFVHDSEREVEAAYAEKYLRGGTQFVEARGRALLRGYAF
jgi:uncharacterized protein (TIGR01627 family)